MDNNNLDTCYDGVMKLQEEGIKDVDYLEMFDKDFLKQLIDNLKCPGGQINVGGAMVATTAFKFGVKVQIRLEAVLESCKIVQDSGKIYHQHHDIVRPNHQGHQ